MAKINGTDNWSKKDIILQKATSLFKLKGYHGASMRHLAGEVGVEAASLYNHIDSKASLLKEICFSVAGDFTSHLDKLEKGDLSQVAKVESVIRFHTRMMVGKFEAMYVSLRDWKNLEEPWLKMYGSQRREYEQRLTAIIEEGIRRGELREVNADIAVLTILSAVRGIESWHRHPHHTDAAELENTLVEILTMGLKK